MCVQLRAFLLENAGGLETLQFACDERPAVYTRQNNTSRGAAVCRGSLPGQSQQRTCCCFRGQPPPWVGASCQRETVQGGHQLVNLQGVQFAGSLSQVPAGRLSDGSCSA